MRPLYLELEGLACFRDRQTLDLRSLETFAISGPTGSGKSTLLDAIIFALYGKVPRLHAPDRSEMISAGCERASVLLEFIVGADRYRISRVLRRGGNQRVHFEKHDGQGFSVKVADAVRAAEEKVIEIVGLGADAFMQAVVLPQGQFANFLKAEPSDQRNMLISLLRLQIYERMREMAQYRATSKQGAVVASEKRLAEDYGDLDEASLGTLETRRTGLAADLEVLGKRRDEVQRGLEVTKEQHRKTGELLRGIAQQEQLQRKDPEVARDRAKIDAAKRAAPLVVTLEQARTAIREASTAREQAEKAQLERQEAEAEGARKAAAQKAAEHAATAIPELQQKIARLHQVIGRLPAVAEHEATLARESKLLDALAQDLVKLKQQLAAAEGTQKAEALRIDVAEAALRQAPYDADLETLLHSVQPQANELSVARGTAGEASRELEKRRAELKKGEETLVPAEKDAQVAGKALEVARDQAQAADQALHRAHRLESANHLRTGLEAGQSCPVCEQKVKSPPAPGPSPKADAAGKALETAKQRLAEAEKKARETAERVTRGQLYISSAQTAVAEVVDREGVAAAKVISWDAALRATLGRYVGRDEKVLEVWVQARIVSMASERKAHDLAAGELAKAKQVLERSKAEEVNLRERVSEKDTLRQQRDEERAQTQERLAALKAEIAAITTSTDPQAEAAALELQREQLDQGAKDAVAAAGRAEKLLATAVEAVRLTAEVAERAQAVATRQAKHRDEEIVGGGFGDEAAVRAAILDGAALATLEGLVKRHDQDKHAVAERVGALSQDLGEVRVTDAQLADLVKAAGELEAEAFGQHGALKTVEEQVVGLKAKLEKGRAVREQLAIDQASMRIYARLAGDLKNDKFQSYLVEETFAELVRGASLRLAALTEKRYSLFFEKDEIRVIDRENADETRLCDTLSGGETFLASLALALELSVQVQRQAGAVKLDSLFIDEGFGTLDAETLAVVSETLLKLQDDGRMVGIITHIPELRDQFKQQILVTKHQGFSTVAIAGQPGEPA